MAREEADNALPKYPTICLPARRVPYPMVIKTVINADLEWLVLVPIWLTLNVNVESSRLSIEQVIIGEWNTLNWNQAKY